MNAAARSLTTALYGPGYLAQGLRMLRRPGLKRYVILPVLGNLLIYALAAVAIFYGLDTVLGRWLPPELDWLRWILFPLVALALIAIGVFAFTLLAALLLSPFLGRLAAAVERMLDDVDTDDSSFWRDLRETIAVESRRLLYAALCLLGVLLLSLVPMLNLIAPVVGFLVSAWLLAGSYAGNPLGNRHWPLRRQLDLLRRHRLRVLAFGSASFALSLVPLVNLVVIPASVIGITLMVRELIAEEAAPAAP